MRVTHRRLLGLLVIAIFLVIYIIIAAQIGNLFVDKPLVINIGFFMIAGLIWVIPLKPLFNWMRAKPDEIPEGEKPPKVAMLKKRR